ncbi:MAG TPA: hypothetical protein VKA91_02115, partial [Nitrososphaeraceae archaeon]|nr:hypothetical protein [Nitrososphaeraceae archaeon]
MKAESNNKSKLSIFYPSSLTTRLTIVYFGVSIGIALQIGAANWDIIWHGVTDVESFFTPPHTVLYSGVALTIGSIFIGIIQYVRLRETEGEKEKEKEKEHVQQPLADKPSELTTTKESLSKSLGDVRQSSPSSSSLLTSLHCLIQTLFKMPYPIKLVAIGTIIEIFSGGFDSWWHYNFGFDGLLSPPHLMLTIGMLTSVFGALIGIFKLLQNNNNGNNSKNILLKISFIVSYAVAWIVTVNTIFMFSLPYSKGQYFDFNPNPFAAIFIATIAIPFVSGVIFYSAAKTLRDVHFRFTFITLAFMIIHSIATIISNSHFAILYPLYLLNIIPALTADIIISAKRKRYYEKEKNTVVERKHPGIARSLSERQRAETSNRLGNQGIVIFCSALVPVFFIT